MKLCQFAASGSLYYPVIEPRPRAWRRISYYRVIAVRSSGRPPRAAERDVRTRRRAAGATERRCPDTGARAIRSVSGHRLRRSDIRVVRVRTSAPGWRPRGLRACPTSHALPTHVGARGGVSTAGPVPWSALSGATQIRDARRSNDGDSSPRQGRGLGVFLVAASPVTGHHPGDGNPRRACEGRPISVGGVGLGSPGPARRPSHVASVSGHDHASRAAVAARCPTW